MALDDAVLLVDHREDRFHGLVVGDALGIVALHDTTKLIGRLHGLLLHHLVVADNVEHNLRCHYTEPIDFVLTEELVGYLDDAAMLALCLNFTKFDVDEYKKDRKQLSA